MVIMVIATRNIDSLKKQSSQWTGKLYQTILKHLETNNGSDLLLISFDRLLKHFPSAAKPVKESAMDLMLKKFAQSNYNPHILTVIVSLFVVETKSSEDSLVDGIVASIYMILNDAFELNSPAELYRKKLSIEISKSNWRQELRKLFQLLESIIQSNTKITIDPVLALLKFIYSLKFTQMEYNDFLSSVNDISDRFLIALVKWYSLSNSTVSEAISFSKKLLKA
ncbi:hypothetical protein HK103_004537 [Boothiomyces macroporosus]|uniref:Uncharacterized protein n=1 Tax=Boothiomyces macroporosus TaxID=261099 RepID=A0AAD5Y401_9FUNG|nr:hypothetical protein HK103_004537 [Boothiomyces macroporosus]